MRLQFNTSPQAGINFLLWVRAAIDKFKARMALLWSCGRKCGSDIGADKDDLSSMKKMYEFVSKDKYDKEFGWTVEYGIYSVEQYFFVKGRVIQSEVDSYLDSGKQTTYYESQGSDTL